MTPNSRLQRTVRCAPAAEPERGGDHHPENHRGPGRGGYGETRRLTGGATVSPQAFPDLTLPLTEIFA